MAKKSQKGRPERTAASSRPPIRAYANVQDIDDGSFYVEYRFRTVGGGDGRLLISRGITSANDLFRLVMKQGADLPPGESGLRAVRAAMESQPSRRYRATRRTGWHQDAFVHPDWTEAPRNDLKFRPSESATVLPPSERGSLADWQAGLRRPASASPMLSFAIGVAFGAPLLYLLEEDEGAVFNFSGPSSTGKSTALRACQSVFDSAAKNQVLTYGLTPRAAEEACYRRCDLVVAVDEEGALSGSAAARAAHRRKLAFLIPGGAGDRRSEAVGSTIPNLTWRAFGLTTGEEPLEATGTRVRADGERLRHIDIPVTPHPAGIYDRVPPGECAEETASKGTMLTSHVERTLARNHGVALRPYIQALQSDPDVAAQARRLVDAFIEKVGATGNGWEERFARKFGIVAAGMHIAAEQAIAPWMAATVMERVEAVYRAARQAVRSTQEQVDALRRIIRGWRESGLVSALGPGESLGAGQHGFVRLHATHGPLVAIHPERLAAQFGTRSEHEAVLSHLARSGDIVVSRNGKRTIQLEVVSDRVSARSRWVCFRASFLRD